MSKVNPIPKGYHTVTPYLLVKGAAKQIEFLKKTFGAKSLMKPADQFWGDRHGGVQDAFGNQWWMSTHIEDVSPAEMQKRVQAMS